MKFTFLQPEDLPLKRLPLPVDVLAQFPWRLDSYNKDYLAGSGQQPDHGLKELRPLASPHNLPLRCRLPETSEEKTVIGNLSDVLDGSSSVIIAETGDFIQAECTAKELGYRPARPGEYLQILWCLSDGAVAKTYGWFLCYEGQVPGYAILACFDTDRKIEKIVFDIYCGDLHYISANMETSCFFVKP